MNTPKIRFKGFADDWEQRKVSELFRVTRGYVLAATQTNTTKTDEKPYPVYSSQTKDKGLMGYYKDYLYEDAITWTTDGANAGTVNYRAGKFYCTNVCGVLLSNEVKANQMIAEALNNVAKGYVSYVGNPKLMNNVMADIVIQIPTQAEEREMLSSLFASLDYLITLHQRKRDETKQLKKFMLQKMFPKNGEKNPEIRFEGFTDDWEQRKVGDQMYIKSRIGWQALTKQEYLSEGDYYLITGTDIDETTHRVDLKRSYYVSKERYEMDSKIQVKEGDIIVTKDGTIGKVAMVTGLDKPATLNSHLFVLRDMSGKLDNHFLLHILNSHMFNHFVKSTKTGSTLTGLPQKTFVEFAFLCPKYEEQKLLSNYFDRLDHLITLHQRKCEKLKELKKFMLQNMFV